MNHSVNQEYDYIITGAGCAGLSLLMRMMEQPVLRNKKILVIEASAKGENDRTWCFWEKDNGFFDALVFHKWKRLCFYSSQAAIPLEIEPYQYKMIRGIDFYIHCRAALQQYTNISWLHAQVQVIGNDKGKAFATVNNITYKATHLFNSILFKPLDTKKIVAQKRYHLLQHFKGWLIETAQPAFNPNEATFMDFRVSQQYGTAFVYVLPVTTTKALVEYTFFNDSLLPVYAYDDLLRNYLTEFANITTYDIKETEYGVIPMTNHKFTASDENITNIGTAGGWTKASSGFTFQFIQKNTEAIVSALAKGKSPLQQASFWQKRFHLYDATLLQVLQQNEMGGREVFHQLFSKLPPQKLFRFLDNESSFIDELAILSSVPSAIFLPAAIKEMFR